MHSSELNGFDTMFHGALDTLQGADELDAWTEAEQTAMRILLEATGFELGRNAFLGEIDDIMNSFCLVSDAVQTGGEVLYSPRTAGLCIPYTATGMFDSRRGAQRFVMSVVRALPVRGVGNVDQLRLSNTGIGALNLELVEVRNEPNPRLAYRVSLNFDLVFRIL